MTLPSSPLGATEDIAKQWFRPCGPPEVVVVLAVVFVLSGVYFRELGVPVFQAKFSEALMMASAGKLDVVESIALEGWLEGAEQAPAALSAESFLSGRATARTQATGLLDGLAGLAGRESDGEGQSTATRYVDFRRIEGMRIIVGGRIDGDRGMTYEFALTAAVADGPTPRVALWVCGDAPPPPGWVAIADGPRALPPRAQRPSVCNGPMRQH